eukprot:c25142_g1_i1 orf=155-2326(+)
MKFLRSAVFFSSAMVLLLAFQLWLHQPQLKQCPHWFASCSDHGTNFKLSEEPSIEQRGPLHPLDPLTVAEILNTQAILIKFSHAVNLHRTHPRDTGSPNRSVSIHAMVLHEPDKKDVLAWREGALMPPRKAFVLLVEDGTIYEIIVDLSSNTVESEEVYHGSGKPTLNFRDIYMAQALPLEHPEFLKALKSRNLKKEEVNCLPHSVGWYGVKEDEGKRLIKVQCYYLNGTTNFYMRPIEGITFVVNLDLAKVVEYIEHDKAVPLPKAEGTDFRLSAQKPPFLKPLKTISLEQPDGRSFKVDGHSVKWANWEFHVKPDYRAGCIISQALVQDPETGALRSVLYKGFASELFVPYMDPTEGWYFKTYLDAGEYGFGTLCMALQPLNDCPRNAYYMDGVYADSNGKPYIRPNMLCIFESYAGDVAWRHTESPISDEEMQEVRPKVTLVVRVVATAANYDYILDWEFQTDGLIRVKVGMSGILMAKGTAHEHVDNAEKANEVLYGTMVAERTVGVIHDHFVTFYLDLDVDGTDNTFVQNKMVRREVPKGMSPRKSYWGVEKLVAKTEKDAKIKITTRSPADYTVINSKKTTKVGNPVSYKIVAGKPVGSLLALDDFPQIRAAFLNNQMWVTPYNRSEEYAGGLMAYQSHGDDTLASWTTRDRPIEDEDIVVWYTVGFHHIPSQEDFPVMPTVTESFQLKPTNFFERNPILKTHPNYEKDLPQCTSSS